MEPLEVGSGECVAAATAKVEIRRKPFTCGFPSCKRRLLLLEGRETTGEGGSPGLREALREGRLLLLLLLLSSIYHNTVRNSRSYGVKPNIP